ncbi:MAG TPA: hypothetical protein VN577_09815 [Terriglobales bacterium]|nr:hypothetical protein [Terriglobales bacterium]
MKKAFVLTLLFTFCLGAEAQFEHPDLKSGKKHIQKLVLMPIQAEISRVSMKGPEPMMEESRKAEKDLTPVVMASLKDLKCEINDTALAPEVLKDDAELRYVVDDLQKKYDATMEPMIKKSKDVRKGRFTMGDIVTKLPAGEGADALVFVRASAQVLTGGKKAFGWIVGGQAFDVMQILVGVVDAKNGDVLYFAKPVMLKNLAKDPADAKSGIDKSFKNFAKANNLSAPAQSAASQPPAAQTQGKPSEAGK